MTSSMHHTNGNDLDAATTFSPGDQVRFRTGHAAWQVALISGVADRVLCRSERGAWRWVNTDRLVLVEGSAAGPVVYNDDGRVWVEGRLVRASDWTCGSVVEWAWPDLEDNGISPTSAVTMSMTKAADNQLWLELGLGGGYLRDDDGERRVLLTRDSANELAAQLVRLAARLP